MQIEEVGVTAYKRAAAEAASCQTVLPKIIAVAFEGKSACLIA